ncbi:hypothetical protein GCM10017559_36680 [Streptosporangium longisporum]|uniref:histidine kinase n=1 Tax=Streptosporangium longisporum TaxID=46187 RepID=A0ABN3Y1P9_9ACTN
MWRADSPIGQMLPLLLACVTPALCLTVVVLVRERRLLLLRLRSWEAADAGRQRELARARFAERRARIARELHDIVAQGISMMTLGVGAGRMIMSKDPERARETLRVAEEAGRQALVELQRALSLLDLDGPSTGRTPQPRLSDLGDLLAGIRARGLRVEVVEDGRPAEVGLALELVAYRIVQEALANTLRHAGADSARVTLRWRPGFLEVSVRDDGHSGPPGAAGAGLLGMRERAVLFGGTLEAGVLRGGGFEVRARLPTAGEVSPGRTGEPGERARGLVGLAQADREGRVEVVPGVGPEGDVRLGVQHPGHLVDPPGDHLGDLLVGAHPDHGHQVVLAGYRVDLAHPVDLGDRLGDLGDPVHLGVDVHDRGDHELPPR